MSTNELPPLLQLGGAEQFRAYEREFNRLYMIAQVTDILGNRVLFERTSCWHVCFRRDEQDRSARRPRDIWSQERAEHILWIEAALASPHTEVRPNDHDSVNRLNYLLALEGTYYIAVAERTGNNNVRFVTAYPITVQDWKAYRRAGKALYPPAKKKGE